MAKIAVMIPCLNEELTIAKVVHDFRKELPEAEIYVFDNGSTDATAKEASKAGAIVRRELRRGKGFVVQSMFHQIDADVYVMVDGDDTYPARCVTDLIQPVLDGSADMTVGSRLQAEETDFRLLNRLGNRAFLFLVNFFLRSKMTDILSGFRAMNRNFVKSIPLLTGGFEIETELTIKAVQRNFRIQELPTPLSSRPPGSSSKIRIVQDGFRILGTILALVRDYKPLTTFGSLGLFHAAIGAMLGIWCVAQPAKSITPSSVGVAALAVAFLLGGPLLIGIGLMLHVVARHFMELEYLCTHSPSWNAVHQPFDALSNESAVLPLQKKAA